MSVAGDQRVAGSAARPDVLPRGPANSGLDDRGHTAGNSGWPDHCTITYGIWSYRQEEPEKDEVTVVSPQSFWAGGNVIVIFMLLLFMVCAVVAATVV